MSRRACLIVNPSAAGGRPQRLLAGVRRALEGDGVELRVESTRSLDHARELAREAAGREEVAVTLGGDGLVGAVAGELAVVDGLLGILPGGRGNDFARVLGIPLDAEEACAVISTGIERRLDLGEVNGRPFIGIASAGFDSVANRIANEAPARLGNLVYAYGALRALATWRPARFDLELDGERRSFEGYSVAAANSKAYGGGMFLAPDAELDDGLLDVVVGEHSSKRHFLATLPKVFKGEHVHDPTVHVWRCAELRVSADRPFVMYADGDPIGELPVVVRVRARVLRALVPGPQDAAPAPPAPAAG
ncbi:MAG TPA: diacylglycerol kinase family protein [Solirubrobacteraceae bacterium]|nr:diacylglycerol kinase family protein [Solirubrobacteraceae bacterium]